MHLRYAFDDFFRLLAYLMKTKLNMKHDIGGIFSPDSAVLFDPNNAEKIGESINSHIYSDDKLNNLKKIGFERSKLFNTEKCAAKTLDLYKEILN